jgi:hypothetical protein
VIEGPEGCCNELIENLLCCIEVKCKNLLKNSVAPWYISNVTLHNDLSIPYVTEDIRTYAKNHKNRNAQNNNQLIRDLFNQPEIGRRLNRMWPVDLIR